MKQTTIHLGYEVGTGEAVSIPLHHTVVTGQTQLSGKTTTLEALIARSQLPAVAFVTKRGERSFTDGQRIQPYFRERADWQFVASVLEATMRERLKFERAWIMRASKGARTLADVQRNVRRLMETAKGMSADVYLTLEAYLDIVVPRVASVTFAHRMDLAPGLNVLDLSDRDTFPPELQALVMRSVIEWVYEKCHDTITIIPEAWEFIPQSRGSPVKLAAVELIRKGAGLHNYVWLDSQDIGGMDKELLRSCMVWLLGVQREANEIKRVLASIPAGIAKPKPSDVATLEKGQFFACFGRTVVKTYVQPAWMVQHDAHRIATGRLTVDQVTVHIPAVHINTRDEHGHKQPLDPKTGAAVTALLTAAHRRESARQLQPEEEEMSKEDIDRIEKQLGNLAESVNRLAGSRPPVSAPTPVAERSDAVAPPAGDEEAMYQRFKQRLVDDVPAIVKLLEARPEIQVTITRTAVEVDLTSARGMIAKLLAEGFLDKPATSGAVWKEMKRRWSYGGISARAYEQLQYFNAQGFVTNEGSDGYRAVPEMKKNIVTK